VSLVACVCLECQEARAIWQGGRRDRCSTKEGVKAAARTHACRDEDVAYMHNYLSTSIVIEPRLDFLASTGQRTMIVDTSGRIVAKTVHDHEKRNAITIA
jgi:hypothetical protein